MDRLQLVTFERIVREGSFNRAARALDLSQAAISGRMRALEAEVGGPLCVRGGGSGKSCPVNVSPPSVDAIARIGKR